MPALMNMSAVATEPTTGWDAAIAEAESQLKPLRNKVARLMASIQTFREAKASGLSFSEKKKKAK